MVMVCLPLMRARGEGLRVDDKVSVHQCLEEGLLEGGIDLEEACSLGKVDRVLEVGVVLDDWGGCVADKLQGQHWMVEVEEVLREEG